MLDVTVIGGNQVSAKLTRVFRSVKYAKPLLGRVGQRLVRDFSLNMRSGVNPEGVPLEPVAHWVRVISAARGRKPSASTIPLYSTGTLSRSLRVVRLNNHEVRVGWAGRMARVAETQYYGLPSVMKVKDGPVKGVYSGIQRTGFKRKTVKILQRGKTHKTRSSIKIKDATVFELNKGGVFGGDSHSYCRINMGKPGEKRWITKQIQNGSIDIQPRARRFFYLSRKQEAIIVKEFRKAILSVTQ